MGWENRYSRDEDGIPIVMETSSGRVHNVRKSGKKTLCGLHIGYVPWGKYIVRRDFRNLSKEDKKDFCPLCYNRLEEAGLIFPWSTSIQAVRRLSGIGLFSAQEHGEDRVSISVEEIEPLVSLIRRSR